MPKKIKHKLFKVPIMATVKVLGMYQDLPSYGTMSFFMLICFGIPFIPIVIYSSNSINQVPPIFQILYFALYVIQTFVLGKYIGKIGRQWTVKEYEKLTSDQVTFPFILTLVMHSLFHLFLFSIINNIINISYFVS